MSNLADLAKHLEGAYTQWHRISTRPHATPEDKQEALATMKAQRERAEETLRQPTPHALPGDRSKVAMWSEMIRGTLKEIERGQR